MIILHAYRIVCLLCLITPHRDPKSFGIQLLPKIFPFTYKYFFCFKWLLYVKFFFSFQGCGARSFSTWDSILVQYWSWVVVTKRVFGFSPFFSRGQSLRGGSGGVNFCIFCPSHLPLPFQIPASGFTFTNVFLGDWERFPLTHVLTTKLHNNNYDDLPGDAA